ncbi:hypothetical protein SAMN05421853_10289 [Roseivivax halotolerans]|uniref:Uncharacterized protein n=1 Tax=Roseivivax halotolerans TaxID=93684 RepID=A0A1I5W2P5_9RHOB|nr:hypothetical protein [Roseivivax halotolerans]SFQ13960.1 hypothetical protein SAMN05421853_10289 [Roseivivax halotolerans]
MKKSRAHVTDHAVIRYLERELDIDIETVRRRIGRAVDAADVPMGASGVAIGRLIYKLAHDESGVTVITCIERSRPERGR